MDYPLLNFTFTGIMDAYLVFYGIPLAFLVVGIVVLAYFISVGKARKYWPLSVLFAVLAVASFVYLNYFYR